MDIIIDEKFILYVIAYNRCCMGFLRRLLMFLIPATSHWWFYFIRDHCSMETLPGHISSQDLNVLFYRNFRSRVTAMKQNSFVARYMAQRNSDAFGVICIIVPIPAASHWRFYFIREHCFMETLPGHV